MQFEPAFRTRADGLRERLQYRATLGATRNGAGGGHLQRPWAEGVVAFGRRWSRALLGFLVPVHVSGLSIFPVGQVAPPAASLSRLPGGLDKGRKQFLGFLLLIAILGVVRGFGVLRYFCGLLTGSGLDAETGGIGVLTGAL